MNIHGMVQLMAATPHSGGYAYCFGIENLARARELTSAEQLTGLLTHALGAAIAPADGVATGIAFRAARTGQYEDIAPLCAVLSSDRLPAEMRLASLQMGTHLWEKSRHWDWTTPVHEQLDPVARRADLHHAFAFGSLVSETTASQVRAIAAYLLNAVKSMIDAAVSAIPLDELEGQRLLATVQPTITKLAAECADRSADEIIARRY